MSNLGQFLAFALVGSAGFVVDVGVLMLLLAAGLGPLVARVPAFLAAATFTWAINRKITFRNRSEHLLKQWVHFLAVNGVGGFLNLTVYAMLVKLAKISPIIAVGAGSLSGLAFNYLLSKRLVFKDAALASKKIRI